MTNPDDHKSRCETEHGTAHLSDEVRTTIYKMTLRKVGDELDFQGINDSYPLFAETALMTYANTRHECAQALDGAVGKTGRQAPMTIEIASLIGDWFST